MKSKNMARISLLILVAILINGVSVFADSDLTDKFAEENLLEETSVEVERPAREPRLIENHRQKKLGETSFTAKDIIDRYNNLDQAYGPVDAPVYEQLSLVKFQQISTGYLNGMALDASGKVWTWGYNAYGVQAQDIGLPYNGGMKRISYFVDHNINVVEIQSSYHTAYALDDQGNLYAWGHGTEGQMGDGSRKPRNETIHKVNIPKVKLFKAGKAMGTAHHIIAIDENDDMWAWGYADGGRIPGQRGYVKSPVKIQKPNLGTAKIVDLAASDTANFILDSNGDLWAWGGGKKYQLGNGSTKNVNTPTKMTNIKNVKQISVAGYRIVALTNDNKVYQWGDLDGSGLKGEAGKTPIELKMDQSEVRKIGYTPIPEKIEAGRRVAYFIDQHGRSWAWGNGTYFNFGREGGYETSNDLVRVPEARQYPNIVGDGDTQIYDKSTKFPSYAQASGGNKPYARYGGYSFNALHPTAYDEKYMLKDASGRPVNAKGEALSFDKKAGKYKNGQGEVSLPEIDPNETWISLTFQPMGKLQAISTYLSATTFLDESGNIFKTALDGSGTIAWGWDFDPKYDLNGSAKSGLYDRYAYEVLFMRGMPGMIAPVVDTVVAENKKIYMEEDGSHDGLVVEAKIKAPETINHEGLNVNIKPELDKIDYVFVPYDKDNPDALNLNISGQTKELTDLDGNSYTEKSEFDQLKEKEDSQGNLLYKSETLRGAGPINPGENISETVEVKENGVLFIRSAFKQYGSINSKVKALVVDNFYTKVPVLHTGLGDASLTLDDGTDLVEHGGAKDLKVYDQTADNVYKLNNDSNDTRLDWDVSKELVGVPFDSKGRVINYRPTEEGLMVDIDPSFGYDQVEVSSYDPDKFAENGWDLLELTSDNKANEVQKFPAISLDDRNSYNFDNGKVESFEKTFNYLANANILSQGEIEVIEIDESTGTSLETRYVHVEVRNANRDADAKKGRVYIFKDDFADQDPRPVEALDSSNILGVFETDDYGVLSTKDNDDFARALIDEYGGIYEKNLIARRPSQEETIGDDDYYPIKAVFQQGDFSISEEIFGSQKLLSQVLTGKVFDKEGKKYVKLRIEDISKNFISITTEIGAQIDIYDADQEKLVDGLIIEEEETLIRFNRELIKGEQIQVFASMDGRATSIINYKF